MQLTGILIMATAVATSIACFLTGTRELHIMRGQSLRLTLSRPDAALNDNYAVVSLRVQAVLFVAFLIGLGLFAIAVASK